MAKWVSEFYITVCHICVGLTPISHNAEALSQYDLGCWCKTITLIMTTLIPQSIYESKSCEKYRKIIEHNTR